MIKGQYNLNGINLIIGQQNFSNQSVTIIANDEIVACPMFIDEDGDIGFLYDGNEIYFRYVNYL